MDEYLRNECKYLKCYKGITYKQLADSIGIKQDSFYNWLKGYYDFKISGYNSLLKEKGLISIDTYRDEQGHTRNRYTINT